MVSFPENCNTFSELPSCPCDGFSSESTLYLLFFSSFYSDLRKYYILPIAKDLNIHWCRPALLFLQQLPTPFVCCSVDNFIWKMLKIRLFFVNLEKLAALIWTYGCLVPFNLSIFMYLFIYSLLCVFFLFRNEPNKELTTPGRTLQWQPFHKNNLFLKKVFSLTKT